MKLIINIFTALVILFAFIMVLPTLILEAVLHFTLGIPFFIFCEDLSYEFGTLYAGLVYLILNSLWIYFLSYLI